MINRLLNTFIPFTLALLVVTAAIIMLDRYAEKISVDPELTIISSNIEQKEELYTEYELIEPDGKTDEIISDSLFVIGNKLYNSGNKKEAEQYFSILYNQYPENVWVINKLGVISLKQKKYDKAIEYFNKCIELDPKFFPGYTNLGISFAKSQKYKSAEEVYLKLIELQPNHSKAHLNLSILYIKLKDWKAALKYSKGAVSLSSGGLKAKSLYYKGFIQINLGDSLGAKQSFDESILLKPDYVLPRIQLALTEKSFEIKKKYLNEVILLNPMISNAYCQLANLYFEDEDYVTAESNYLKALDIDPDNQEIVRAYGNLLILQDRNEEAETLYIKYMERDSLLPQSYFNIAKIHSYKNEFSESLRNYNKAIELAEGYYPEAYLNRGLVYKNMNDFEQAVSSYQTALKQNSSYHEANYNLALLYTKLGDTVQAAENYKDALKKFPKYEKAWFNLAKLYDKSGQTNLAINAYREALKINPGYLKSLMNLAILYRKKEDYANSINIYNVLLQKFPKYIPAKYNLALVYKYNKDTVNSLREFQEVLQTEPNNIKAIKQVAELYTGQKNYQAALNVLNDAVNIDNSDYKLRFLTAEVYYSTGNNVNALFELEKCIVLKPNYRKANLLNIKIFEEEKRWRNAAIAGEKHFKYNQSKDLAYSVARNFDKAKDLNSAEKWYLKAIDLGKDKSWVYYWLGKLYYERAEFESGKQNLLKAINKDKNHKFAYYYLGKIEEKENNIQQAISYYEQSLSIDPEYQKSKNALQKLK